MTRWEEYLINAMLGLLFLGACAVLIWIIAYVVVYGRAQATCLGAGYSLPRVTFKLERYCVRRGYNTEIVVPVAKLPPTR